MYDPGSYSQASYGESIAAVLHRAAELRIRYTATHGQSALLAFLAAWAFIASFRAYGAYNFFAERFAITVWRDYLAFNVKVAGGTSKPEDEEKH